MVVVVALQVEGKTSQPKIRIVGRTKGRRKRTHGPRRCGESPQLHSGYTSVANIARAAYRGGEITQQKRGTK
jgi:hypothetical protein